MLAAGCMSQGGDGMAMEQEAAHEHAAMGHLAPHYPDSHFQITDNKLYSVELLFKGGNLSVGMNAADHIANRHTAKNQDVEKAAITVTPWMPAHGMVCRRCQSLPKEARVFTALIISRSSWPVIGN